MSVSSDSTDSSSTRHNNEHPVHSPSLRGRSRTGRSRTTLRTRSGSKYDPEKADDEGDTYDPTQLTATTSGRLTRTQSLTRRRNQDDLFTHPLSHVKTTADVVVNFEGPDDPYRPMNWPFRKKCITTALYGLTTAGATFASSVLSPAVGVIADEFQVGTEVSILTISLLILGFGLGTPIWAPLSEMYGRRPAVLIPFFIGAMFTFGSGGAKDIQTLIITRFFTGIFACAPVTNTGGVLGDIWDPAHRGTAIVFYAMAVVGGPVFGPIVGGAIVESNVTWRWTEWVTGMYMMVIWVLDVLILDESYPPALLKHKATRLRISTGNWALHAKHEEWDPSFKEMLVKFGVRPFRLLATPICFLVALYASFVYGVLYASFAAFPIIFQQQRGWNPLIGSLPFLAFLIGIFFGAGVNILNQKFYISRMKANNNKAVPEARLPPMMIGSVFLAGGIFILGWTSTNNSIPWIASNIGAAMIGLGFFTIFQAAINYLVDTFAMYSASAIGANTFLRSCFAAAFPLFIDPMYAALGIGWATSVFGFVAAALIPIPFLFYIYGARIRKRGKYSRGDDEF